MADRDPAEEVETLRRRIQAGERGNGDETREVLLDMSDNIELIPSEVGDYRHRDILRRATRMSEEVGGLVAALEDRDAAEKIVQWINDEYSNEHTNQDYRKDLRAFGRYAGEISDDPPESLAWIPSGTSNDFDPTPSERDLLMYSDEVKPMLEACENARDAAVIALQFEAGLRGGELFDLRVGDVFEAAHTKAVHVDGKRGERVVHLSTAIPWLNRWLSPPGHPAHTDAEAPLWCSLDHSEKVSYNFFLKIFRRAAARASVDKEVTPTNFRKSNTRWLITLGMTRNEIEQRQGRITGSKHTARYEAAFGEESLETRYAALHGMDVEPDEPDINDAPVACLNCSEETPRDFAFCIHCGQSLDLKATQLITKVTQGLEDHAIESDDPTERSESIRMARTLRAKPNIMDKEELHEFVSEFED